MDPNKSLGVMPDFLHFLQPKIEKVMSHFKVSDSVNKVGDPCKKVEWKDEHCPDNIKTRFGYFD